MGTDRVELRQMVDGSLLDPQDNGITLMARRLVAGRGSG